MRLDSLRVCIARVAAALPGVETSVASIASATRSQHDVEESLIATWTRQRQAEFRSGRQCARAALARLGCADQPITFDSDGAPIWPTGFLGSISHKRGFCTAATAVVGSVEGLGIDIELDESDPELWDLIATPSEREAAAHGVTTCRHPEQLLFAAKEAIFKYQFPRTRRWLKFNDVELEFGVDTFRGALPGTSGEQVSGRYLCDDGWVTALAYA